MKILLDTNIIIHREAEKIYNLDIGQLFNWIDKLKYDKYIHPLTIIELNRYKDQNSLKTMNIKIESYNQLKYQAPLSDKVKEVSKQVDTTENDINDTQILNEVFEDRVDRTWRCLLILSTDHIRQSKSLEDWNPISAARFPTVRIIAVANTRELFCQ